MTTMATAAEKPNPWNRLRNYLHEVRVEIDKVTWPTRDDLKAHTVVVLWFLVILGIIVGAMDWSFQKTVLAIFRAL
jgi:preprotein translocase subunit SecE